MAHLRWTHIGLFWMTCMVTSNLLNPQEMLLCKAYIILCPVSCIKCFWLNLIYNFLHARYNGILFYNINWSALLAVHTHKKKPNKSREQQERTKNLDSKLQCTRHNCTPVVSHQSYLLPQCPRLCHLMIQICFQNLPPLPQLNHKNINTWFHKTDLSTTSILISHCKHWSIWPKYCHTRILR